jgi:uncharacterized protein YbjT (DUF2867 family)
MPVLVTAAETALGRAAAEAFVRTGGQVRVWIDPERAAEATVASLRGLGCKVAQGTPDDEGRLELALEQVHTVVHTGGGPLTEPGEVVEGVASVVSAALGAGCRRIVWLSWLGAEDPGDNAYLQACAEAEALLAESPLETVVIRRALTYAEGDELTAVLAGGVPRALRAAVHAPVHAAAVAIALVAADRRERSAGELHLVVEVAGARETTLDGFVDSLDVEPGSGRFRDLPAHVADLLGRDTVGSPAAVRAYH